MWFLNDMKWSSNYGCLLYSHNCCTNIEGIDIDAITVFQKQVKFVKSLITYVTQAADFHLLVYL